ncbi:hypothetical protein ACFX13_023934 [Malus domestica]
MESRRKVLRALFGALLLLVVFWFFLAGILVNRGAEKKPTVTVSSTKIFKHWKLIGREKHTVVWDSTFIYVSKRRVPNGPDPIHNRRAVKTRQPPTRA